MHLEDSFLFRVLIHTSLLALTEIKDFDLDENSMPTRFSVRGEYTKTRTDRTAVLTNEMAQQLKLWIDYKYRTRRVSHNDQHNTISKNKTITDYRTTTKDDTDLIFAVYQNKDFPKTLSLYHDLVRSIVKTLDRMG